MVIVINMHKPYRKLSSWMWKIGSADGFGDGGGGGGGDIDGKGRNASQTVPGWWVALRWLVEAIALIQRVSLWWIAIFRMCLMRRLLRTFGRCACASYNIFNIWWCVTGIMITIRIRYDHTLWWWRCDLCHNTIRTSCHLNMFGVYREFFFYSDWQLSV